MCTSTASRAFQSSELSRNARELFAAAEEQPISVTRRDGEDLVLMSKREADAREQLLQLAAQLITISLDDGAAVEERMTDVFPWMLALSPRDRETCSRDLLSAARASFATGQAHLAAAEMLSWKETAVAVAAGLGVGPVDWFDTDIAVKRP